MGQSRLDDTGLRRALLAEKQTRVVVRWTAKTTFGENERGSDRRGIWARGRGQAVVLRTGKLSLQPPGARGVQHGARGRPGSQGPALLGHQPDPGDPGPRGVQA